tara:strand:- start:284 stop:520 length:237 start_codon:yes stop_codon:yes gene_type:complete
MNKGASRQLAKQAAFIDGVELNSDQKDTMVSLWLSHMAAGNLDMANAIFVSLSKVSTMNALQADVDGIKSILSKLQGK